MTKEYKEKFKELVEGTDDILALQRAIKKMEELQKTPKESDECHAATHKYGCDYCDDSTDDIFYETLEFMGESVAHMQVFINDGELELFMDTDHSDAVLIKKKVPINFCPFCGRDFSSRLLFDFSEEVKL